MSSIFVKNASYIVTMDNQRSEIQGGGLLIRNGVFEEIGVNIVPREPVDHVFDLDGHIILPGLINTHHHFYQTLTRVIPEAQDANLFNWLKTLYPIWGKMTSEHIQVSTKTALVELAFSGCTTASDHLYIFPNGSTLDDEILSAHEVGLRLHASRGSMSVGESQGGLPPDSIVEDEEFILKDSIRLIEKYHNPNAGSFIQVVLAPCSPFSVSPDLMRESAKLAREFNVHLHTHLAETKDEELYCMEHFGHRPVDYMDTLDWVGEDVWFAHSVYVTNDEISTYVKHKCGVAHCPSSNMRLASGIAPIMEMLDAGVPVGLGVDGSASNDSSNMLAETRMAMLASRVRAGYLGASDSRNKDLGYLSSRQAIELATINGAQVLGRNDIGSIEIGKSADFVAFDLNKIEYAGAMHDPVSALVFCSPQQVSYNVVGGNILIYKGEFQNIDMDKLIIEHNKLAGDLLSTL